MYLDVSVGAVLVPLAAVFSPWCVNDEASRTEGWCLRADGKWFIHPCSRHVQGADWVRPTVRPHSQGQPRPPCVSGSGRGRGVRGRARPPRCFLLCTWAAAVVRHPQLPQQAFSAADLPALEPEPRQ